MKRKKLRATSSASAAAILAGGVLFSGPASAALIFLEDFETVNAFGMSTYAYSQNYTLPNSLTPPGDAKYATSGTGINGQVSTNFFPLPPLSLTAGSGVSAGQIDSGAASYDFRAQFSTYRFQGDYAQVSITFRDAANAAVGSPVILGGDAFTAALSSGPNPLLSDARAWGESAMQGIIPAGARTLDVVLSGTKGAGGAAIDGYVDNVSFTVAVIPEPAAFALGAFGCVLCLRRRRR